MSHIQRFIAIEWILSYGIELVKFQEGSNHSDRSLNLFPKTLTRESRFNRYNELANSFNTLESRFLNRLTMSILIFLEFEITESIFRYIEI